MTSVDLDGKNLTDLSENLGRAFGRGQFLTDRLHMDLIIFYVEPNNAAYVQHRQQQEALEVQHRRLTSV